MSWNTSLGPIKKSEVREAIRSLQLPDYCNTDEAMLAQLDAAKCAAIELTKVVPGPMISISFHGHANAVGFQKKDGYANDCIGVTVSQVCEPDLQYYSKS